MRNSLLSSRKSEKVVFMTVWILKCRDCGSEKEIDLGFNLYKIGRIYIYCEKCRKNTFHDVIKYLD